MKGHWEFCEEIKEMDVSLFDLMNLFLNLDIDGFLIEEKREENDDGGMLANPPRWGRWRVLHRGGTKSVWKYSHRGEW